MRTMWLGCLVMVGALASSPVWAQAPIATPPRLEHADVAGYFGGSQYLDRDTGQSHRPWHRVWTGGASFGYYWTDHRKTEVEFTRTGSTNDLFEYAFTVVPGTPVQEINSYTSTVVRVQRLSVLQEYQFFRNTMVHPFVGAGAAVSWDRRQTSITETIFARRPPESGGFSDFVSENTTTLPSHTTVSLHALAIAGVKAYVTERSFFRADVLVGAGRRTNTVAWKIGFGWDF